MLNKPKLLSYLAPLLILFTIASFIMDYVELTYFSLHEMGYLIVPKDCSVFELAPIIDNARIYFFYRSIYGKILYKPHISVSFVRDDFEHKRTDLIVLFFTARTLGLLILWVVARRASKLHPYVD